MDTQQHENGSVRHTTQGPKDVSHVHWQHDSHTGDVQARVRAIHVHVPAQGFFALVHWRGHGRDGVHRGRVQHE